MGYHKNDVSKSVRRYRNCNSITDSWQLTWLNKISNVDWPLRTQQCRHKAPSLRRINLKRRQLLALPLVTVAASLPAISAEDVFIEYSREIYEAALASGEPFMLDFYATW